MPFNKTEVKDKLRKLISQIYQLEAAGEIRINEYADFVESLETLWEQSVNLYQKDKNGKYKTLDANNYGSLIESYGKALETSSTVLLANELNPELKNLTENINGILHTDLNALKNVVPGKDVTLPELIEKGRSTTLFLGNVKLAGAGNALSNRIPIEYKLPDGNNRKGFFTKKIQVPGLQNALDLLKPIEEKYPEYKRIYDSLHSLDEQAFFKIEWSPVKSFAHAMQNAENPKKELLDNVFYHTEVVLSDDEMETLSAHPTFMQFMYDMTEAISPIALAYETYCNERRWLGGKPGERIDNRNSAMSMISKLLGHPELVAPAEPMTLMVNGEEVEGTFMANAHGTEVFHVDKNDPIRNYKKENFDNPAALTQIANMQVIDYICGNIDRHEGNFFMQFEGEGENAKLSKLTLIDNDLSFGKNVEGSRIGNKFVTPKDMGIIDKDMALKVMGLTKSALNVALKAYDLSDEQIDFAWQRTQALQNQVTKSMEAYQNVPQGEILQNIPRIVSKEDMGYYHLDVLAKKAYYSQFEVFTRIPELIRSHEANEQEEPLREMAFNTKHGITPAPPKEKINRITGVPVENEMFFNSEESPVYAPVDFMDVEIPQDAELDSVGGALSHRKAVNFVDENGNPQKGFFTSRMELNRDVAMTRLFKEMQAKYPQFIDPLKAFKEAVDGGQAISAIIDQGLPGYSASDIRVLNQDVEFSAMLQDLCDEVNSVASLTRQYKDFGANVKGNVEMRNVGMTEMAKLLGNGNLLANARPMRLKQGDIITEGVFMDMAEGVDLGRAVPGDPILDYGKDVYNYGPGLKSLSDLQILDYICMNVDRHSENMMYQFAEVDGQMKFVGVQGIDNDLSFSSIRQAENERYSDYDASLDGIKVISKEQAEHIRNLKADTIESVLIGCKLNSDEITAAIERAEKIRARIDEGKIRVLSDEDWKKETLDSLDTGVGIFKVVKDAIAPEALEIKKNMPLEQQRKEIRFQSGEIKPEGFSDEFIAKQKELFESRIADTENFRQRINAKLDLTEAGRIIKDRSAMAEDYKAELNENRIAKNYFSRDGLAEISADILNLNRAYKKGNHFFGGSKEFTKAAESMKELLATIENIPNQLQGKDSVGRLEVMEDLNEQIQLANIAAKSLDAKTANSTSSNQKDRNAFAKSLLSFSEMLTKRVGLYNRSILDDQRSVQLARAEKKAEPFVNFVTENFPDKKFDNKKEDEYLDFLINAKLNSCAKIVQHGEDLNVDNITTIIAAKILKDSINEATRTHGEDAMAEYVGKVKTMHGNMKKNDVIKNIAQNLAKEPEAFPELIVSGKFDELYGQFKEMSRAAQMQPIENKAPKIQKHPFGIQNSIDEPIDLNKKPESDIIINM